MSASVTVDFQRPPFDASDAERIARELFDWKGSVDELPSERDRNFRITAPVGDRIVLKISQGDETAEILDLQHRVLERLRARAPELTSPHVVISLAGREIETVYASDGTPHLARALSWVPGKVWAEVQPHTPDLLRSLGAVIGAIDAALEGFEHPAAARVLKWDLARSAWIRAYLHHVGDGAHRAIVERHLERFERDVVPRGGELRHGVIHNDANDWNVIVGPGHPYERRVAGLVDFGDAVDSWVVSELAIACAYAMQDKPDPLAAATEVVTGYCSARPLDAVELELLFPMICTRLAVSAVNAAEQRASHPENAYLTISEAGAWHTLERLESVHPRLAHYAFRGAAGLEPSPQATAVVAWLRANGASLGPVIGIDLGDPIEVLDLAVGSPLIETIVEPDDLVAFTRKVFDRMRASGASVAIGRYNEARALYVSSLFQTAGNEREIPRTVHIGLDLFAAAGTPVLASLDGIVESVRDNGMNQDYGPTVILRHAPVDGPMFFTLHGHLGRDALDRVRQGQRVSRGDRIGTIGDIDVNGGWTPHLHLQLITDLLDRDGEFPGVARSDQRALWLSLSPDPNLLTRLPAERLTGPHRPPASILASRRAHVGPSLSILVPASAHHRAWLEAAAV